MTRPRLFALAAAGFAFGAATTVATALVVEGVARRIIRAVDEAELADIFPPEWLR